MKKVYWLESTKMFTEKKMRKLFTAISLLLFVSIVPIPAFAWNDVGHEITAYIAWQRMSPIARENVIKILRKAPEDSMLGAYYAEYGPESEDTRKLDFFMLTASWADVVRSRDFPNRYKKYHKSNWHYSDTFWKQNGDKVEIIDTMPEGGQGLKQLIGADVTMRSSTATDAEKALAIAWFMHIGGDLHQPLHTSGRITDLEPKGDQGGNKFLLTPEGTPYNKQLNLHWFWDSIVNRQDPPKADEICGLEYIQNEAKKVIKAYPYKDVSSELKVGNFDDWLKGSFDLVPKFVFSPDLKRNELPSKKYMETAYKTSERQLALAGYRIGDTLEQIFGSIVTVDQNKSVDK